MSKSNQTHNHQLSAKEATLFTIGCVAVFIIVALFCSVLTSWIPGGPLKICIREVMLRIPLTLIALHFFAKKVIRIYAPASLYTPISLVKALKWIAISIFLPALVWLFYYKFHFITTIIPTTPMNFATKEGVFIKWFSVSIAAGLTEEILFRGHLFKIWSKRYSTIKAALITSFVFGMVHIFMLPSFNVIDALIVLCGGILSGYMFSYIYIYTKSIWYAVIVHIIWDIFFIGKILAIEISQKNANQDILAFKLTTKSILLSGGGFGIEAGLPGFVIYLIVGFILYLLSDRKDSFNLKTQNMHEKTVPKIDANRANI